MVVGGVLIVYLFNKLLNRLKYFTIIDNSFVGIIVFVIKLVKINYLKYVSVLIVYLKSYKTNNKLILKR